MHKLLETCRRKRVLDNHTIYSDVDIRNSNAETISFSIALLEEELDAFYHQRASKRRKSELRELEDLLQRAANILGISIKFKRTREKTSVAVTDITRFREHYFAKFGTEIT